MKSFKKRYLCIEISIGKSILNGISSGVEITDYIRMVRLIGGSLI